MKNGGGELQGIFGARKERYSGVRAARDKREKKLGECRCWVDCVIRTFCDDV